MEERIKRISRSHRVAARNYAASIADEEDRIAYLENVIAEHPRKKKRHDEPDWAVNTSAKTSYDKAPAKSPARLRLPIRPRKRTTGYQADRQADRTTQYRPDACAPV